MASETEIKTSLQNKSNSDRIGIKKLCRNKSQEHVTQEPVLIIIFITIIMVKWLSLVFFTCTVISPVLCCDWLMHYDHLSNQSLSLIKLMGGQLTKEESPVFFPKQLYRRIRNAEVDSQLAFIRDSLKQIQRLWRPLYRHDNLSSVTWDPTYTEHFLMIIFRQYDEVKRCVSKNRQTDSQLVKYYRNLKRRTLTRKGARAESWELIRRETKLHLDQLHMLATSISCAAAKEHC